MSTINASDQITSYINETTGWRGKMLARLRKVILDAAPSLVEEWKWNTPVWSHDGNVVAFQNGPPARREEGASRTSLTVGGANHIGRSVKLVRDVTDEQRSRRPIFNATLLAAASWLFFRVARSTRMIQIWALRYRQSGSDRLEKQPTDLRRRHHLYARRCTSLKR